MCQSCGAHTRFDLLAKGWALSFGAVMEFRSYMDVALREARAAGRR